MMAIVESLKSVIETVEQEPEENTEAVESLKEAVTTLQDKITAIMEKLNQNETKKEEVMTETQNYLKSTNALADFCQAIRNTKDSKNFPMEWGKFLTANSVAFETGAEAAYMPDAVKGKIEDAWNKVFPWLSKLNRVNAKQYVIRWNKSNQDAETSRAKGHKKGEVKVQEEITFDAKTVVAKCVYKLQVIDNETIWNDDASLLNYVLDECLNQWFYEVAKSVLIGDGRSSATPDLRVMGITPIKRASTDLFVTVATRDTTTYPFLIEELVKLRESVKVYDGTNDIMLFMSQSKINELRKVSASSTSTPVYIGLEQLCEMIGVSEIVECDYLGADVEAIMFRASGYTLIGENAPRMSHDEDIKYNQQIYRFENFVGGDVEKLHSAAVLKAAE